MSENHCLCLWAGLICRQSLSLHFSVRFASTRCGSLWFCLICLFAVYFRSFLFGFNERLRPASERVSERQRQQQSGGAVAVGEGNGDRQGEGDGEGDGEEESTCVWNDTCTDLEDRFTCVCVCVCGALFESLHVQQVQSTVLLTLPLLRLSLRLPFSLFLLRFHKSGNCFKDILRGICRVASSNCLHCENI